MVYTGHMSWRVLQVLGAVVLCAGCYRSHQRSRDAEVEDTVVDTVFPDCPTDWVGECISPTDGDCNIVDQCGCCPGQACAYRLDSETCEFIERCVDAPTTPLQVGDDCNTRECPAGSICLVYLPETTVGHCFEWCRTDADCSAEGEWCNLPSRFHDDHPTICPELGEYPQPLCSDGTYTPME